MKTRFDWIVALLLAVILATLIAFFAGVTPYPYSIIVLSLLLVFRLASSRKAAG